MSSRYESQRLLVARDWRQVRRGRAIGDAVASRAGIEGDWLAIAQRCDLAQAERHAVVGQDATDRRPRVRFLLYQVEGLLLRRRRDSRAARHVLGKEQDARRTRALRQ